MIELIVLFSIIIPYGLSIPLSLYLGSVLEKLKNYKYYHRKVILKKKNDDYIDDDGEKNSHTLNHEKENETTKVTPTNPKNNKNNSIANNTTSLKQCFLFNTLEFNHPSKFYIYYTRFSLYFIVLIILIHVPAYNPEIKEIFTIEFWIPSKLTLEVSIIGFIISMIFGQPWLDNPIIQMNSAIKYLNPRNSENCTCSCFKKCAKNYREKIQEKKAKKEKEEEEKEVKGKVKSNIPSSDQSLQNSTPQDILWNPLLHFNNNNKRALLIDITRFICSFALVPVMEEIVFRFFFYRFIIGGFNYKLVSYSTWKWTAAILSNIALTQILYIRCYEKGREWMTGLINGYLCTYSMVKQGHWSAAVITHSLINLYIGLFVLITKKYEYWY